MNCAAEYPDGGHPARRKVREHKAGLRRRLSGLAAEVGAGDPETLAERLFVLLEGAYVSVAVGGDEHILGRARHLAQDLVATAVVGTGSHG